MLKLISKVILLFQKNDEMMGDLKKILPKNAFVIDVGAHIGEFTNRLFENVSKNFRVNLYEPIPDYYNYLKKYFKTHKNIKIFNYVVGRIKTKKLFYISLSHPRSSTVKKINKDSFYFKLKKIITGYKSRKIFIKQINLDKHIKKQNIDLLKIDAEGNELEVLKGCQFLLQNKKIKFILIEILNHNLYKNYNKKKIFSLLKKNNYYLIKKYKYLPLFAEDRLYGLKKINY